MEYRRVTGWVILFALLPFCALAAQSTITDVSVYADRAQVTRTATVDAPRGEFEIVFGGLPASLDNNSPQVWGEGSAMASLEGVVVEMEPPPEAPEGKVAELENRIRKLNDRQRLLEEKSKAIHKRISMLVNVRPAAADSKGAYTWGAVSELGKIVDAVASGLRQAYSEQRSIDAELRRIKREIAALRKELNKVRNPSGTRTKRITVNLNVTRPGKMTISFSYIVPGATWRPLYDIRALPNDGKVEITGYAEIIQRTGENWDNVSLSVSTAKPQVGGAPPKVEPIYLVFYSPPPPQPAMAPRAPEPEAAYELAADTAATGDGDYEGFEEEIEADIVTAQVKTAGTAVFFEVKQKKTIPSDGEPHRVPLSSDSLTAEFNHASWPEARPFAYLRAKTVNTTDHPFVAGDAKVFLESSFIGSTRIGNWAQTEEKIVSLGVDQGVRVERKLIRKDEKETGSKKTLTYEYKITVKNFKKKDIRIELFDRVPTSRQGDIEVKTINIEPEPAENKDNGILKWILNIGAGDESEVSFSYSIRFPKDRTVVGLP